MSNNPSEDMCSCWDPVQREFIHDFGPNVIEDLYADISYAPNSLRIGFVNNFMYDGGEIAGIAKSQLIPPLSSYNCEVVRKVFYTAEDDYGNPYTVDYELPWVIVHETGHTYGCDDHFDHRNCVMDVYYLYEHADDFDTDSGLFCDECLAIIRANRLLH